MEARQVGYDDGWLACRRQLTHADVDRRDSSTDRTHQFAVGFVEPRLGNSQLALTHLGFGDGQVLLGRAALHLGRLEEAAGHKHQAHQALELAWRVAGTTGDWGLFNAAAPAWIEHLRARGDVDNARAALTQALTLADTTPYGPMFRAEAQRRWGAELS